MSTRSVDHNGHWLDTEKEEKRMMTTINQPRWTAGIATLGLLLGLVALPVAAAAQATVGGTGYGALVSAGGVVQRSSTAVLPSTGGMSVGDDRAFGVPNALASEWLTSITTGAADNAVSSSQTSASVENVSVLNGLIRADIVTAVASSYVTSTSAFSDAEGSGFVNLVVSGVPVTVDPAPNTRVDLPGVGFAVLNEQIKSGNGVTSSGMMVNMIHVVVTDALTGATIGEIVVGSASSSAGL